MKKTLLITLEFPPNIGGVGQYYWNLVRALPVGSVMILAHADDTSEEIEQGVLVRRTPFVFKIRFFHWIKVFFEVYRVIQREKIETLWIGHVLPLGYIGILCKIILGMPYTVFCHGMDVARPLVRFRKRILAGWILKAATLVIANSNFTRTIIEAYGVDEKKIFALHPSIQSAELAVAPDTPTPHSFFILTVCRLVERKGVEFSLRAFAKIAHTYKNFTYIIAGEGDDKIRLEKIARDLGLADRIFFQGAVKNKAELAALYSACSVFIMLPFEPYEGDVESFGMAYLEANLFGKPVVGTWSGGVLEAIINNQTGILVPPQNVDQAAFALKRLLGDSRFAQKLGCAGRERVLRHFSPALLAERLLSFLA